jgi:hypothetical protein
MMRKVYDENVMRREWKEVALEEELSADFWANVTERIFLVNLLSFIHEAEQSAFDSRALLFSAIWIIYRDVDQVNETRLNGITN